MVNKMCDLGLHASLLICYTFNFRRVTTFIRYIKENLKFGLPDCVRFIEYIVLHRGSVPCILLQLWAC